MKFYPPIFIFILVFVIPFASFAQFTGFGDETVSPVYWGPDSTIIDSNAGNIGNETINITHTTNEINDTSINANLGDRKCNLSEKTFRGYVNYLGCSVRVFVLPFIFTIAVVGFIYGVILMISNPGNEEATTKGKTFIMWGIIGFFVITSMYALIAIIRRTAQFGYNAKDDATPYNQLKDKIQNIK